MADTTPDRDDSILKRRARRRLVGAVALALVAVVVLPMVFDPEPRPLGDQVEIRLPDQNEPFAASTGAAPSPATVPNPGFDGPSSALQAPAPSGPVPRVEPEPVASHPPIVEPAMAQPEVKAGLKPEAKAASKPEPKAVANPTPKPETKPEPKPASKPEAKPAALPTAGQPETRALASAKPEASDGQYYLQIGVFSSETNAQLQVAKAKAAGFKAASTPSGGRHRVRVGPIEGRDKALDYQRKLKARGVDTILVES